MPADLPRRADRLEQAEHQAAALFPVIAVAGRILQHRPAAIHPVDRLGQQVVVLGGLQRDVHPGQLAKLPGPHPGAVDDVLGLDVAARRAHAGHRAAAGQEPGYRRALDDPRAAHPGAPGQRHRHVDRVHPAVGRDIEAGQHVIGPRQREQLGDLARRDLVHLHAAQPVERRDPPVLLQPPRLDGQLDEPDLLQAGREPGLGLQPGVQVPGVHPQLGRGLRGRAEGGHQPGRVPGRAGGQPVALEQQHVGNPEVREVVGDRGPDDAAADDDDTGPVRDGRGARHGHATLASARSAVLAAAPPGRVPPRHEHKPRTRPARTARTARLCRGRHRPQPMKPRFDGPIPPWNRGSMGLAGRGPESAGPAGGARRARPRGRGPESAGPAGAARRARPRGPAGPPQGATARPSPARHSRSSAARPSAAAYSASVAARDIAQVRAASSRSGPTGRA